jgi:AraC-like DNA-binding protein
MSARPGVSLPSARDACARETHRGAPSAPHGAVYRELAPPPHLRDYVVCFWRRETSARPSAGAIVPDGCVDVIWRTGQPASVAGPMTVPFDATSDAGTAFAGIRFRPGVASHVFGVPASELRDRHVPLRSIWPQREMALWEAVSADEPSRVTVEAMSVAIADRVRALAAPDPFVIGATAWIVCHPFGRIDAVGRLSGLSERQVRRRFDDAVGYGPKLLQRIVRLQYLLWLAGQQQRRGEGLAPLALAAGYADQPHMTREVAALTGASPRQLLLTSLPRSAIAPLFQLAEPALSAPRSS